MRPLKLGILLLVLLLVLGITVLRSSDPNPKELVKEPPPAISEISPVTLSPETVKLTPLTSATKPTESSATKTVATPNAQEKASALKKALSREPENAKLLAQLGTTLATEMNAPDEGIPYLEKSVQIDSNDGKAFYDLVGAYLEAGRTERGEAFLNRLLEAQPSNSTAIEAAKADLLATSGRSQEAQKHAEAAAAQDPYSPESASLNGSILLQNGDPKSAEAQLKHADELYRDRIETAKRDGRPVDNLEQSREQNAYALAESMVRNGNPDAEKAIGSVTDPRAKENLRRANAQQKMAE